jgi:hypothetical protein
VSLNVRAGEAKSTILPQVPKAENRPNSNRKLRRNLFIAQQDDGGFHRQSEARSNNAGRLLSERGLIFRQMISSKLASAAARAA